MYTDDITRSDIGLIATDDELSLLQHLDACRTQGGKVYFQRYLWEPLSEIREIIERQQSLQTILNQLDNWPDTISNGTMLMMEKFLDSPINIMSAHSNRFNTILYRLFNSSDFSLIKFSIRHFNDFLFGISRIISQFESDNIPAPLAVLITRIIKLTDNPILSQLSARIFDEQKLQVHKVVQYGYFLRFRYKQDLLELFELWYQADALFSMAYTTKRLGFKFPTFIQSDEPYLEVNELWHPLLENPIAYDIHLNKHQNFVFLTGANMAGKSTFIKAVAIAAYLAHTGMGVPAGVMKMSLLNGLLTNIQVRDNVIKGESYFYNEVQRIKHTISTINNGEKWLVLIDELFKGTNIQDAMKCSTAVVEGLVNLHQVLFILSTHLYEIGEDLKKFPNILFRYFETSTENKQLVFQYKLKEGISNDRIGYLILQREGVVQLLEKLKNE
jgi:DNA mismatch repair ATPase MutS